MKYINDEARAFPSNNDSDKFYNWIEKGITIRDYFAAKAMQALIQASTTLSEHDELNFERVHTLGLGAEINVTRDGGHRYTYPEYFSEDAYLIADAMLKEREI
jgi:hypothetical protein